MYYILICVQLCTGWWFGTFFFHFIYGMSSFPLTFIFFKMVIAPPTSACLGALAQEPRRTQEASLGVRPPPRRSVDGFWVEKHHWNEGFLVMWHKTPSKSHSNGNASNFLKTALNTNFRYMKEVCERILSGFLKYCHYPHVSSKHSQSPFSAIALKKQKSIDSKEKDANNPKQNPKHITYPNNVVYSQLIGAWFVRGSGHPWIVGPKDGRTTWITI